MCCRFGVTIITVCKQLGRMISVNRYTDAWKKEERAWRKLSKNVSINFSYQFVSGERHFWGFEISQKMPCSFSCQLHLLWLIHFGVHSQNFVSAEITNGACLSALKVVGFMYPLVYKKKKVYLSLKHTAWNSFLCVALNTSLLIFTHLHSPKMGKLNKERKTQQMLYPPPSHQLWSLVVIC